MKEMLKAVPVLTRLLDVRPGLIRAHARNKIGDIGRYCIVTTPSRGTKTKQYYIMRADIPKVLHRNLTEEEEAWLS